MSEKITFNKNGLDGEIMITPTTITVIWDIIETKVKRLTENALVFQEPTKYQGNEIDGMRLTEEIISRIRTIQDELRLSKKKEEYSELYQKISEKPLPEISEEADDQKVQEILSKQKDFFEDDSEMSGVNLSIATKNEELQKQAEKYCEHELEISYRHSHTSASKKKLIRIITCEKCGLRKEDIIEEEPTDEEKKRWAMR